MTDRSASRRVDQPIPGLFKLRLVPKAHFYPASIAIEGEAWRATLGKKQHAAHQDWTRAPFVSRIWLSGTPIEAAEYAFLLAILDHAAKHIPDHPILHPNEPIDINRLPPGVFL